MSDINSNSSSKQNGSLHRRAGVQQIPKKSTRVDLTPMVDLGFLLITFFVFTTTMARPVVMQINQPYDKTDIWDEVCASCVLTVLLDKNDKISYYEGDPQTAVLKETDFSAGGIRRIITDKKQQVKLITGNAERMVLIIKPLEGSHFKNFVDMADEVTINNIKKYYIDEIRPEDNKLIQLK